MEVGENTKDPTLFWAISIFFQYFTSIPDSTLQSDCNNDESDRDKLRK